MMDHLQGTFKSVTGTFIVPTPKAASGQTSGSASAWVGIDGDTCGNAILQTGVDFTVTNGKVSYDGEWHAYASTSSLSSPDCFPSQ